MIIYTVKKYNSVNSKEWNGFVLQSKNGSFLFHRNFMDYHSDRFEDFSLMIYKAEKLVAILPANKANDTLYSHQGLTYGGLLLSKKSKLQETTQIFQTVLKHLDSEGIKKLHLKLIPKIYHRLPSDEIDYLLFITEAKLLRTDVSTTIDNSNPLKIQSNRTEGVKKAENQDLSIAEDNNFEAFWNKILIPNLKERHSALPVHSLDEIKKLANYFPNNIKQFNVYNANEIVAGATVFETDKVVHVQYISANSEKQQLGSLDFLFNYLITKRFKDKRYFDFGVSNENNGKNINEGLLYWKECFGGRSIVHQFYEVETSNYTKLDPVFI